jgi:hypothetical protein
MSNFNHKEFKLKALEQIGPTTRVYSFDPMIIISILSALGPILSGCLNKVTPQQAAQRIKSGDMNTKMALTKAIKETLKNRGEKSNPESREALRESFTKFLCNCDDEEIEGLCNQATKPNFDKLAL